MKYITELEFETKPNYSYLRNLFLYGGSQDGNIPSYLYYMKESNENFTCSTFFERPYLRERKPCRPVNGEVKFIIFKNSLFIVFSSNRLILMLSISDTNNAKYAA